MAINGRNSKGNRIIADDRQTDRVGTWALVVSRDSANLKGASPEKVPTKTDAQVPGSASGFWPLSIYTI